MFRLVIAKDRKEERLAWLEASCPRRQVILPLFGISSEFLRVFSRLPRQGRQPEHVYKALAEVTANLIPGLRGGLYLGEPRILHEVQMMKEEGATDREWFHDWFWFSLEVMALENAFVQWLTPRKQNNAYLKPSQRYIEPLSEDVLGGGDVLELISAWHFFRMDLAEKPTERNAEAALFLENYARYAFWSREKEITATLSLNHDAVDLEKLPSICLKNSSRTSTPELIGYHYEGPGLLSLAWLEVAWALMNDQYAHKCDVCGGVFALGRPYTRPAYICSKECAKAWRVQKAGGLDALRAYNREAQRRHRAKQRTARQIKKDPLR